MEAKKKFFKDCHLAGRMYYDADEVWDKLKVGTVLQLVRDKENGHDPDAVAVMFYDAEADDVFHIGYIPRTDNEIIAAFLDMGWTDVFECRIRKIKEDAHPEYQIYLTIKIKRNKIEQTN